MLLIICKHCTPIIRWIVQVAINVVQLSSLGSICSSDSTESNYVSDDPFNKRTEKQTEKRNEMTFKLHTPNVRRIIGDRIKIHFAFYCANSMRMQTKIYRFVNYKTLVINTSIYCQQKYWFDWRATVPHIFLVLFKRSMGMYKYIQKTWCDSMNENRPTSN